MVVFVVGGGGAVNVVAVDKSICQLSQYFDIQGVNQRETSDGQMRLTVY